MIKLLIALLISVGAYAQCTLVLNPKTRVLECAGSGGGGGGGVSSVSATGGTETSSGAAITNTGTIRGAYIANAQTGTTYTFLTGDRGKVVTFSNASPIAVTLPQAGTGFEDGWFVTVKNIGNGDVTITPTTSTISGAASIIVRTGESPRITSDGANYEADPSLTVDSSLSIARSRTSQQISAGPTLVTLSGPQTLTNKDLTGSTNSIGPNAIKAYVAGGGTAQAQTATLSPALPAYVAGGSVCWLPAAANTATAPTLNVNGLGAKTITKLGTTALVANDLTTTAVACAIYDGTQYQLQNPQVSSVVGVSTFQCYDHMFTPTSPTSGSSTQGPCGLGYFSSGAAAAATQTAGISGYPGILSISTGIDTTGTSLFRRATNEILFGGNAAYTSEVNIRITTASDGTNTYSLTSGIWDGGADGCYFGYTHSVNSGNWTLTCVSNSVSTVTNSSVAAVAGAWTKLTLVVNAAGTSVEGFVNGVSIGTVTSNIPTSTGRETGWRPVQITKSAGTTARTVDCDYAYFEISY